jgi:hypothetical protein
MPSPVRADEAEHLEIAQLKREVIKLKAERDILKKSSGQFREGIDVKFDFIVKHRGSGRRDGCARRSVSRLRHCSMRCWLMSEMVPTCEELTPSKCRPHCL